MGSNGLPVRLALDGTDNGLPIGIYIPGTNTPYTLGPDEYLVIKSIAMTSDSGVCLLDSDAAMSFILLHTSTNGNWYDQGTDAVSGIKGVVPNFNFENAFGYVSGTGLIVKV